MPGFSAHIPAAIRRMLASSATERRYRRPVPRAFQARAQWRRYWLWNLRPQIAIISGHGHWTCASRKVCCTEKGSWDRARLGAGLPCLLYTSDAADDLLCVDLG